MQTCLDCNKQLNSNAKYVGTKRCSSCAMKERFKIPENNTSFGKRYTKEEREKHSKACMGNNKGKKLQVWQIEYLRSLHLGKKDSHETRMKKRASMLLQREKHWNWKGGVWEGNSRIRKSLEIKIWRFRNHSKIRFGGL